MQYSAFNKTNNDQLKEPMFFGNPVNVSRFDQQKHETFERLTEKQLSFFWRPEEIDISKDRIDFKGLTDSEQHIFLSNLKYQIILDSIQGRSPNVVLLPLASIPELETWIELWAAIEGAIHARSYTHIIRGIVDDPTVVFDDIMVNPSILKRAEGSSKYYDELFEYSCLYNLAGWGVHTLNGKTYDINPRDMKKKLYLCLVSINVLEAIRFYVSFACSFAFGERKLMEGNASIIKMIARDEACVDAFTEVATPTGWKYISELTENDKVAQYDVNTRAISYVVPNKLIKSKTNVLHWYNNKHMEQVVTPDHRMVYLNANLEPKEALSESFNPNTSNYMFVSGYANGQNTHLTPFERLLIMIQADGSISKRYDGSRVGTIPVKFTFSKERKIKRMIDIFNSTGFSWAELKSDRPGRIPNRVTQRNFKIDIPVKLLEVIDPKLFSSWVNLEDKNHVWCNDFINELINWDGHIPKDKSINYVYYSSMVEENVSTVQLIASLAGFNAIKGVQHDNRSETYSTVHRLWLHPNRNFRRNGGFVKTIVPVEGEQEMYCVSVPTGAFLMRRNGKVSVTGNCHMNGTQFMLNLMHAGKDDPITKEICAECKDEAINMFKEACEQEMEWADYLFKDGSMIGLNAKILKDYIRYITNIRMSAIGFEPLFPEYTTNPIPWINNWLSSDNVQVAPQETEITSYLVGQVTSDLEETDFDNFSL